MLQIILFLLQGIISLRRLAAPICSLAEKHRIEGVSDEERRIFATGAYYGLDKVSRALYAAPLVGGKSV